MYEDLFPIRGDRIIVRYLDSLYVVDITKDMMGLSGLWTLGNP